MKAGDLSEPSIECKGEQMNWPGQKTLFLKSNCKVMLVWNKSDDLKNGSMGFSREHKTARCLSNLKMLALSGLKG